MEFFDAFCGVGPWIDRDRLLPYRPEEILSLLDHYGIARALVHSQVTVHRGSAVRGNRLLREACAAQPRFVPAFSFPPWTERGAPGPETVFDLMFEAGARAVWMAPSKNLLHPWLFEHWLPECVALRQPVFLHREAGGPDDLDRLLQAYPGLRLVLVGAGYGDDWWLGPLLRRHAGLHVCTGHYFIPSGGPARFLDNFPADRLLFGSGLPEFSPGGHVLHLLGSGLSDADLGKILGGNLDRLLAEAMP